MARRRCQHCTRPLGRFAKLFWIWTCKNCAARMSMGGSPLRPPTEPGDRLTVDYVDRIPPA